jgi:serine/threonine protein kinase
LIPEEEAALVPHGGVAVVLQVETVIIPAGEAALTPEREASLITEREAAQQIPRREAALIPVEGSAHIPAVPAEEIALIPGAEAVVVPGAEALLVPEGALDPRPAAASAILGADASAAAPPISPPLVGRLYALKCLPKAPLLAAGRARQALNERRALAACHGLHPCLPLLHGAFQDAFHLFLLLEAVPGVELFYLLREARRFEPSTCALYLAMTGSALAHLHERGWVHRDVKPENLLLDAEGYIKLVDFGLATRLAAAAERTWTLCGTPEYTAPEVRDGDRGGEGRDLLQGVKGEGKGCRVGGNSGVGGGGAVLAAAMGRGQGTGGARANFRQHLQDTHPPDHPPPPP